MTIMRGTAFICLLLISTICFCQSGSSALSGKDYLEKSSKQTTASYILLGAGAVSTISAFTYGLSGDGGFFGKSSDKGGLFAGIGIACVTAAIPLRIASKRNQGKAAALSAHFMNQNRPLIKKSRTLDLAYPALCLKMDL